jgi:preprotein translocase subunit SecB
MAKKKAPKPTDVQIRLRDLHMASCSANKSQDGKPPPEQLNQEIAITVGKHKTDPVIAVTVRISLSPLNSAPGGFSVTATFAILFDFMPINALNEMNLEEFGRTVSLLHVWPYWREFVHSTTTRMGLPPLRVPLLNPISIPGLVKAKQPTSVKAATTTTRKIGTKTSRHKIAR